MKDQLRQRVLNSVEEHLQELYEIRTYLYEHPEVGGEEKLAYEKLTGTLRDHGFDVSGDFHGIDYCFRAVYYSGREGPVIGLTCEFDALPGIGHGCGHDIIAAAPLGAAFALQSVLDETGGRVVRLQQGAAVGGGSL